MVPVPVVNVTEPRSKVAYPILCQRSSESATLRTNLLGRYRRSLQAYGVEVLKSTLAAIPNYDYASLVYERRMVSAMVKELEGAQERGRNGIPIEDPET